MQEMKDRRNSFPAAFLGIGGETEEYGHTHPIADARLGTLYKVCAADGIVLLRNEKAVLPLPEGETVALFGVSQLCYYKSGTGSGGMVNVSHVVSIREALEDEPSIRLNRSVLHLYDRYVDEHPFAAGEGWGKDPWSQAEMPLDRETAEQAGQDSRTAIVVIGRTAGEDRDNKAEPGSFLLTETELDMLRTVRGAFARMVVLLNTGTD